MKHKQIRSAAGLLLLAVLMLSACLLISCRNGGEGEDTTETAPPAVTVDLSGYAIVRPERTSQDCLDAVAALRSAMSDLGAALDVRDDWYLEGDYDPAAKEILVGGTNREESGQLLSQIQGEGYAIRFTEHKVVIAATRDSFLTDAVAYFVESILKGSAAPSVQLGVPVFSDPYRVLILAADGKTDYTIIRQADSADYTAEPGRTRRYCTIICRRTTSGPTAELSSPAGCSRTSTTTMSPIFWILPPSMPPRSRWRRSTGILPIPVSLMRSVPITTI